MKGTRFFFGSPRSNQCCAVGPDLTESDETSKSSKSSRKNLKKVKPQKQGNNSGQNCSSQQKSTCNFWGYTIPAQSYARLSMYQPLKWSNVLLLNHHQIVFKCDATNLNGKKVTWRSKLHNQMLHPSEKRTPVGGCKHKHPRKKQKTQGNLLWRSVYLGWLFMYIINLPKYMDAWMLIEIS